MPASPQSKQHSTCLHGAWEPRRPSSGVWGSGGHLSQFCALGRGVSSRQDQQVCPGRSTPAAHRACSGLRAPPPPLRAPPSSALCPPSECPFTFCALPLPLCALPSPERTPFPPAHPPSLALPPVPARARLLRATLPCACPACAPPPRAPLLQTRSLQPEPQRQVFSAAARARRREHGPTRSPGSTRIGGEWAALASPLARRRCRCPVPAPGLWRRRAGAEVSGAPAACGRLWVWGPGRSWGRRCRGAPGSSVAGPEPGGGRAHCPAAPHCSSGRK